MTTTTRPRAAKKYDGPSKEEKLVTELIGLIEKGVSPWQCEWRKVGAHTNPTTGNQYSGSNVALLDFYLMARGYDLPLWCGAGQAKKVGLRPKKGSKGCYIMRPVLFQVEDEKRKDSEGKPLIKAFTKFKLECVFNLMDLDGNEEKKEELMNKYIEQDKNPKPIESRKDVEQKIREYHKAQSIETSFKGERACYSVFNDAITMPKREFFKSIEGFYATWLHECVHSTGHEKRLKRGLGLNFKGDRDYAKEELIAELGAYLCCKRLEISSKVENHASYLKSWVACLRANPNILFKSLSAANKACNLILGPETKEAQ
tara:strand:- start:1722 stop:2666 length:945 start_codon:yes stop_codon:yes gene_type:complete